MSKDPQELEHGFRGGEGHVYEPEPPRKLEVTSVPMIKELKDHPISKPRPASLIQVAAPETVVANRVLRSSSVDHVGYKTFVFQYARPVPARICAVVPDGLIEFTRALIFFHPLPTKRAGYDDAQYAAQTGGWNNIYRYCDQQGAQFVASKKKMVLIFPIFNLASVDTCGVFPDKWQDLLELIMRHIRDQRFEGRKKEPVEITDVITASYSAGIKYMSTFLSKGKNIKPVLREVWDYDGRFSSEKALSEGLGSFGAAKVQTYDQRPVKMTDVVSEAKAGRGIHIPDLRWRDLPRKQTSFLDIPDKNVEVIQGGSLFVHGAMPRYMMFHSLSETKVGA